MSVCLRSGQKSRNHLQDFRVAHRSVIESGGVDENHFSSVESEVIGELDHVRTGF